MTRDQLAPIIVAGRRQVAWSNEEPHSGNEQRKRQSDRLEQPTDSSPGDETVIQQRVDVVQRDHPDRSETDEREDDECHWEVAATAFWDPPDRNEHCEGPEHSNRSDHDGLGRAPLFVPVIFPCVAAAHIGQKLADVRGLAKRQDRKQNGGDPPEHGQQIRPTRLPSHPGFAHGDRDARHRDAEREHHRPRTVVQIVKHHYMGQTRYDVLIRPMLTTVSPSVSAPPTHELFDSGLSLDEALSLRLTGAMRIR